MIGFSFLYNFAVHVFFGELTAGCIRSHERQRGSNQTGSQEGQCEIARNESD
jgi:hypothetical protein